jgi:hypothetical protein
MAHEGLEFVVRAGLGPNVSSVINRQGHGSARRGNCDRSQKDRRLANAAAAEGASLIVPFFLCNPAFLNAQATFDQVMPVVENKNRRLGAAQLTSHFQRMARQVVRD